MEDDAQMSISHDASLANASEQDEDSPREDLPLSCKTMTATNAAGGTFGMGLDQFELPKASIQKLAKSELPDSIQLRKDSLAALVKTSSVFYVLQNSLQAAASHDVALARGNKTISAIHVLDAMRELDFPPAMRKELRVQLEAYRDLQKRSAAAKADNAARNRAERRAKAAESKPTEALDTEADTTMEPLDNTTGPWHNPSETMASEGIEHSSGDLADESHFEDSVDTGALESDQPDGSMHQPAA
ncbi:DNA-directed DNA polymerase [Malassezia yamatoensis]|uniref:DNA polymerase epsilon subunit D n=1 Tax=Malassezia yamatoensis TaxID=253288 RepID=A0AAJ6CHP9_9BASI|nr:DNA-directed DNA polymerase [Malassezia yamatoensis]